MGNLSKDAAEKLREKAILLAGNHTKTAMELAEVLYNTYYGEVNYAGGNLQLWEAWGFKSWFDYVENELGIHQNTAAGYRRTYEVFEIKCAGEWDKKSGVSFTKMKALARVVNKVNVNSWLKKAKTMSCCELEDAVLASIYGKQKSGVTRHFSAFLTDRELIKINSILEVGYQKFPNCERRGEVLTKILEEWDHKAAKLKVVKKSA